ncbi:MAG: tyrosine-protein phosphatase [Clostridia bacterium]|nr:tyrosine-protein phosphatase [Clostridia bacterium]
MKKVSKILLLLTILSLVFCVTLSATADSVAKTYESIYVGEYDSGAYSGLANIVFGQVDASVEEYGIIVQDKAGAKYAFAGKTKGEGGKFGVALYDMPDGVYDVYVYSGSLSGDYVTGDAVELYANAGEDISKNVYTAGFSGGDIGIGNRQGVDLSDGSTLNIEFDVYDATMPQANYNAYVIIREDTDFISWGGNYAMAYANWAYGYTDGTTEAHYTGAGVSLEGMTLGADNWDPTEWFVKDQSVKFSYTAPTENSSGSIRIYTKNVALSDEYYVEHCNITGLTLDNVTDTSNVHLAVKSDRGERSITFSGYRAWVDRGESQENLTSMFVSEGDVGIFTKVEDYQYSTPETWIEGAEYNIRAKTDAAVDESGSFEMWFGNAQGVDLSSGETLTWEFTVDSAESGQWYNTYGGVTVYSGGFANSLPWSYGTAVGFYGNFAYDVSEYANRFATISGDTNYYNSCQMTAGYDVFDPYTDVYNSTAPQNIKIVYTAPNGENEGALAYYRKLESDVDWHLSVEVTGITFSENVHIAMWFMSSMNAGGAYDYDVSDFKFYTSEEQELVPIIGAGGICEITSVKPCTVTFKAEGVTVDTVEYMNTDSALPYIPQVPEKAGYRGVWEKYTLGTNIVVNAVYTECSDEIVVNAPVSGEVVNLANYHVNNFIKNYERYLADYYRVMLEDMQDMNGLFVHFNPVDGAESYIVKISTTANMENAEEYEFLYNADVIDDLFTGEQYYLQVRAVLEDEPLSSPVIPFKTAQTPRTITLENVPNSRDMGGWTTVDGNRIKQGIVYRTALLDNISEEGKVKAKEVYGIKTDLDLRTATEGEVQGRSPLGDDVSYINISGCYYVEGSMGINISPDSMAQELRVFADIDNYPIVFHCSYGRDRTGTLAMLLEGLCGVDKEDLYRDYELSWLHTWSAGANQPATQVIRNFDNTFAYLEELLPGGTIAQQIEAYALSIGLTPDEISAIRTNLLEGEYTGEVLNVATFKAEGEIVAYRGYLDGATSIENLPEVPKKEGFSGAWESYTLIDGGTEINAVYTQAQKSVVRLDDFANITCDHVEGVSVTSYGGLRAVYSSTQTADAGVDGYEGNVLKVTAENTSNMGSGVTFDFSSKQILANSIESIKFRIWIDDENGTDSYPKFRISNAGSNTSHMLSYTVGISNCNQWLEITWDMSAIESGSISNITDSNGYLSRFYAYDRIPEATMFIDYVEITYEA